VPSSVPEGVEEVAGFLGAVPKGVDVGCAGGVDAGGAGGVDAGGATGVPPVGSIGASGVSAADLDNCFWNGNLPKLAKLP